MVLSTELIRPGSPVLADGKPCHVIHFVDSTHVMLRFEDTGEKVWAVQDLKPLRAPPAVRTRDIADDGDQRWTKAEQKYKFIALLVQMEDGRRTKAEVQRIADLLKVHTSTVYRWITACQQDRSVSSLMRAKRSDAGQSRLTPEVEKLISEQIHTLYLTEQRKSLISVAKDIRELCKARQLPVPDESTIKARIYSLPPEVVQRARYGNKIADTNFSPLRGSIPNANFPLAIAQIDHTPMDVIVVDDVWRKPINRPFLTVAMDVRTRMVIGFFISLHPVGALALGQCMSQSILDKTEWLEERGLTGRVEWPCRGKMRTIHSDNAKEFRGTMLGRACEEHGINSERRPKTMAKYGGSIERGFRTWMKKIHEELPGTTFSSVADKMEYNSEGKAVMTMAVLEKWFAVYILGYYHESAHAGNDGMPPRAMWEKFYIHGTVDTLPIGIPHRLHNEEQLWMDFLPYFERTVQEYGVQYEGLDWYDDSIRRFMHSADEKQPSKSKKFICRYDPRNMSVIYFWDDKARRYITVPFRNRSRPPVSLWEVLAAKRELLADGRAATNEELIFRNVAHMRELVSQESERTKSARRQQQRRAEDAVAQKKLADKSRPPAPPSLPKASPEKDGITDIKFEPSEGIRE